MSEKIEPLDIDVEEYKKRREIAELFFAQYIEGADTNEDRIEAISELISYDSDLDQIKQKMALG